MKIDQFFMEKYWIKAVKLLFWVLHFGGFGMLIYSGIEFFVFKESHRFMMIGFFICALSGFHARKNFEQYFKVLIVDAETGNRRVRRYKKKLWDRAKRKGGK